MLRNCFFCCSLLLVLWGCPQSTPPGGTDTPIADGGNIDASADANPGAKANITKVTTSGNDGSYTFAVTIKSPDTGCQQYADWWEVLSEDGKLLYRRVLLHSHVSEQPFERTGGAVKISATQTVWVRAHMNPGGYGGISFKGSASAGFAAADMPAGFANGVDKESPLPDGCDF